MNEANVKIIAPVIAMGRLPITSDNLPANTIVVAIPAKYTEKAIWSCDSLAPKSLAICGKPTK